MHIDHKYDALEIFSVCPLRTVNIHGTASESSVSLLNFSPGLIHFPSLYFLSVLPKVDVCAGRVFACVTISL